MDEGSSSNSSSTSQILKLEKAQKMLAHLCAELHAVGKQNEQQRARLQQQLEKQQELEAARERNSRLLTKLAEWEAYIGYLECQCQFRVTNE